MLLLCVLLGFILCLCVICLFNYYIYLSDLVSVSSSSSSNRGPSLVVVVPDPMCA